MKYYYTQQISEDGDVIECLYDDSNGKVYTLTPKDGSYDLDAQIVASVDSKVFLLATGESARTLFERIRITE